MIVILGAGITGLYLGIRLKRLGLDFIILDQDTRIGGKIITTKSDSGTIIEKGPAVFHENQKNIMKLMKKFQIDYFPLPKTSFYYLDELHTPSPLPLLNNNNRNQTVSQVLTKKQKLCTYDYDEVALMKYENYYMREKLTGQMYKCKQGLTDLVDKMTQELSSYIHLNIRVTQIHIDKKYIKCKHSQTQDQYKLHYDFLLCAIDQQGASQIKIKTNKTQKNKKTKQQQQHSFLQQWQNALKITQPVSTLMLIVEYHEYPKHLQSYGQILSTKTFRWYLRTGPNAAILSYTDGKRASKNQKLTEDELIQTCCQELNIDPLFIRQHWYCWWPKAFYIKKVTENVSPYLGASIYQTFVPDSYHQGYMEAHLLQAKRILKIFKKARKIILT